MRPQVNKAQTSQRKHAVNRQRWIPKAWAVPGTFKAGEGLQKQRQRSVIPCWRWKLFARGSIEVLTLS